MNTADMLFNQLEKGLRVTPVCHDAGLRVTLEKELTASQFIKLAEIYEASRLAPTIKRSGAGVSVIYENVGKPSLY